MRLINDFFAIKRHKNKRNTTQPPEYLTIFFKKKTLEKLDTSELCNELNWIPRIKSCLSRGKNMNLVACNKMSFYR